MKRKLFFGISSVLFIIIGFLTVDEMTIFEILVLPFTISGDLLRELSLINTFTNMLAIVIFISILLIPLYYLGYLIYKKKLVLNDVVFSGLLSIIIGLSLYYAINPFKLFDYVDGNIVSGLSLEEFHIFETFYLYGYVSIFYALLLLYFIVKVRVSKYRNIEFFLNLMIDLTIFIFLISTLTIELSATVESFRLSDNSYQNFYAIIGLGFSVLINGLAIMMLVNFRKLMIDLIATSIKSISEAKANILLKTSFALLVIIFVKTIVMNSYQLLFTSQINDLFFNLNIPITTILLSLSLYVFSIHIKQVNQLKEDHSLII
ncbi:MAG: hypothetical protein QM489_04920 [Candidatus Izemoplasma sp.]